MRWGKWAGQGWMTLDQRIWVRIWVRVPEKTLYQDKRLGLGDSEHVCPFHCSWDGSLLLELLLKAWGLILGDKCVSFCHHEQFPAGSILHHLSHGFQTRCSTWCFWLWTSEAPCMECVEAPARPPIPTSILLQAALDPAFCVWALWHVASPCFLPCWGRWSFPLLPLSSLPLHGCCCPITAAVLDISTVSKSWTTSRGNALKMRSPTSVKRNRLF